MSTKSLKPVTIKRKVKTLKSFMKHGLDLNDVDSVVTFVNTCNWASGTKDIAIDAYRDYLNMLELRDIKLPHIRREETYPFIPLEKELDALISSTRIKMSTFLRLLKEGALRPIEAWMLQWKDIDIPSRNVTITPVDLRCYHMSQQNYQKLPQLFSWNRTYLFISSLMVLDDDVSGA